MRIKTTPLSLQTKVPAAEKTPDKSLHPTDMKESSVQRKESPLPKLMRAQYAKHNKLPPNPLNGREHDIVAVQLSLIETQKKTSKLEPESKESKKESGKSEEKSSAPKPRQLEDMLRQEESALDYYEAWHNVTQTLSVPDMLESRGASSSVRRLLVVGPAGIGKTTLLHYIAYQWSLGHLWGERFQAVFWLPLRCLLKAEYQQSSEISVAKLLHQECLEPEAKQAISVKELQRYLEKNKSHVALLLDGYDECALEVEEAKSSVATVFHDLLETGSTVFMTSRPYRLNQALVKKFDRYLENRGFSDAQIQTYVTDYFHEKLEQAKSLISLLNHHPRLKGMSHVPLILTILCGLYEDESRVSDGELASIKEIKETKSTAPSLLTQTENLTGLYQQLTGYLVKRYLKERTQQDTRGVEDVELLMHYCQDELNYLGHLAFLGLTQREILLSPTLFKRLAMEYRVQPHLPDKAWRLGFLQKAGEGHRGEAYSPHYFIHLSFQEFFAAHYLFESLKHPKSHPRYQQAMQFVGTQKYEPRYAMVMRFTAGLCRQDKTQNKAIQSFWKALLSPPLDILGIGHLCLMIRCLDETAGDTRVPYRKVIQGEIEGAIQSFLVEGGMVKLFTENDFNSSTRMFLLDRLLFELSQTTTPSPISGVLNICLEAFKDKRESVQIDQLFVCYVLTALGEKAATEPVIQFLSTALKNNDNFVWVVGRLLPHLGEKAATEPVIQALLTMLKNEDESVRSAAAEALGQLGEKAATKLVFQALLAALEDKNWYVRHRAAKSLGQLGEKAAIKPVIQALLATLKDEDYPVQNITARALGQLGKTAATEPVIQVLLVALKNEDKSVRSGAAEALGQIGEKAATEPVVQALLVALNDEEKICTILDGTARACTIGEVAANSLGELGKVTATKFVVQALLVALKNKNRGVRNITVKALGQLKDNAMTEPILQALLVVLKDKDMYLRYDAALALGRLGQKAATKSVLQSLLTTLEDEERLVRSAAAKALGQLGETAAIEPVFHVLLKDEDLFTRGAAAEALGQLAEKAAIEPLLQELLAALNNKDKNVRSSAAEALGLIGERAAIEPVFQSLLTALNDKDKSVRYSLRYYATEALGRLGKTAVTEPVIQGLLAVLENKDEEEYDRGKAAEALGRLGEKASTKLVIQALLVALKDKGQVERAADEALYALPRPAILANYLTTPVPFLRGVNKSYAQLVTMLLLRSTCLVYDKTQHRLILIDGQTHTHSLTTSDHLKQVQVLMECSQKLAKTYGLPIRLTNPTLKDPYPVSEARDLPPTHFSPSLLKGRLSDIEEPLLRLLIKEKEVKLRAEQQQEEINVNPQLREYYYSFIQYFDEAWKASGVIHSQLVAHGQKTTADHIVAGVNLVGSAVSIPGVGLITGALEKAVNAYTYRDKHRAVNHIAGFFTGGDESATYIELLSRILTLIFAEKIIETANPEKSTIRQKAERAALAVKNAVMVGDVNTPIKQLAEAHVEVILKAIIGQKLKPHPKPEDLPKFVELVQAHSHADSLDLSPILTTTQAGRTLLEHTTALATPSRSGGKSLTRNPPATLLGTSISQAFGTLAEHKSTTAPSSTSESQLALI